MLNIKALLLKLVQHHNNAGIYGTWNGDHSLSSSTTMSSVGVNKTIPAGEWIFFASYRFPAGSSTGFRQGQIYINDSPMGASLARKTVGNSALCELHGTFVYKSTVSFTVDIRMAQNTGSAKTVTWKLQAVRIK